MTSTSIVAERVASLTQISNAGAQTADVLVIFGITGDLARVMTFRALYRLEQRGLLCARVVCVAFDDWPLEHLVELGHESIVATGEPLDEAVFKRFVSKLSHVHGDFTEPATYSRVAEAIRGEGRGHQHVPGPPPNDAQVPGAQLGGASTLAGDRRRQD